MPQEQNQNPQEQEPQVPTPERIETTPEPVPEIKPEAEKISEAAEPATEIPEPEVTPTEPPPEEVQKEIRNIKSLDRERQVQVLSNLAFDKGIAYAVSVARGLDNAYVLDKLHDTLVDQLYEELVNQGKLKEL